MHVPESAYSLNVYFFITKGVFVDILELEENLIMLVSLD
jgi:hypothetical protein